MGQAKLLDDLADHDGEVHRVPCDGHSAALRTAAAEVEQLTDHSLHPSGGPLELGLHAVANVLRRIVGGQGLAAEREDVERLAEIVREDCEKALAEAGLVAQRGLGRTEPSMEPLVRTSAAMRAFSSASSAGLLTSRWPRRPARR